MSGHSKWSTIKRKKGALDAKRSKIFSRVSKEITIAVKEGGSADPDANPRLRLAIQNAKGVNMPKDNIARAVSKAEKDDSSFEEVTFEGYATHGVAVFVECLTDNNNRTVSSVRSAFVKNGGNLGTNGSLGFIFDRKGIFSIPKGDIDVEEFELEIIDAGVEDFEVDDNSIQITSALEDFGSVAKKLEEMGVEPESQQLQRLPNTTKELDVDNSLKVMKLIDTLEDNDDVQHVFHNLEMTEELQKALEED
ncbi:MAG: YebC/PmpR family DNA-binding transcriptional regulator [Marinifilaceae bacterium]